MNCEEVEQNDILAGYITGKLPETDRDQFEEHFFGCEECLQKVEAARIAREVLIAHKPAPARQWWIPLLAAAAVLIGVLAIWRGMTPKAEQAPTVAAVKPKVEPSYELLARFDPPSYRPSTLRSSERTARSFEIAMKLYSAGDFAGAATALRTTNSVEARYYLGISELLSGDVTGGTADLQKVIAAGDTPYLSEARFYLAKAFLKAHNVAGSREQLEKLVEEKSELAPRATELLGQLSKL